MHYNTEVFKISSAVLKRFEENLDNGTFFLFNAQNGDYWAGNYSAKILAGLFDGKKDVNTVKNEFAQVLNISNDLELENSVDIILTELEEKSIIVRV